ncbi:hypothetical protein NTGHW29_650078 [Candidatus Nitrotoga sp. HW29]|nr:hypothetical protein NTGHW29_650078 [Candidatus Nitrotoga sp. HW29]
MSSQDNINSTFPLYKLYLPVNKDPSISLSIQLFDGHTYHYVLHNNRSRLPVQTQNPLNRQPCKIKLRWTTLLLGIAQNSN